MMSSKKQARMTVKKLQRLAKESGLSGPTTRSRVAKSALVAQLVKQKKQVAAKQPPPVQLEIVRDRVDPATSILVGTRFTVPETCMKQYAIEAEVGKGTYGRVYSVCPPRTEPVTHCPYVMKVQLFPSADKAVAFGTEVAMSETMAEIGVAPRMISAWICENVQTWKEPFGEEISPKGSVFTAGFMVSERLGITLGKYARENRELWKSSQEAVARELLREKLQKIDDIGWTHNDIHEDNVMLQLDARGHIRELYVIDFGRMLPRKQGWIAEAMHSAFEELGSKVL